MDFSAPNPELLRRSACGSYLIEKEVGEDGVARYAVWIMVKSIYGFKSAQDAADEARSLEAEAVAAWKALPGQVLPPLAATDGATPATASPAETPASG